MVSSGHNRAVIVSFVSANDPRLFVELQQLFVCVCMEVRPSRDLILFHTGGSGGIYLNKKTVATHQKVVLSFNFTVSN